MVINYRLRTTDIKKKVFWYRAEKRDNLQVGCTRFKKFHDIFYDINHDKRLPFIDINSMGAKKKTNIQVIKNE